MKLGDTIHGPLCRYIENEKAYNFLSGILTEYFEMKRKLAG
jgi:hypothetical protein